MIISNIDNFSSMSTVKAKVDLYLDSTLVKTCTCSDVLEQFKINRDGDTSKFFGFGICHKLSVDFIDLDRELEITTANTAVVGLGDGTIFDATYPKFYISEVNRNEKTNSITATAYDKLYSAAKHTLEELTLQAPYTVGDLANACSTALGLSLKTINIEPELFEISYEEGGNFNGTESLRLVLDAIAEVTQSIYYINHAEELVFKRLDRDGEAVYTIEKDYYYELNTKTNRKLTAICSTTELGDNLEATTGETGTTQYIRNNPLWDLHPNRATMIDAALEAIGGLVINQFNCDWYGDYRLEIGDKINLIAYDGSTATSYLLCDLITYAGTLSEITEWEYTEQTSDTANNPTNIGDKINQTFAKVDKVSKRIDLVAADVTENSSQLSQLSVSLDGINGTVESVKNITNETIEDMSEDIATLTKKVSASITDEHVKFLVTQSLQEGISSVTTTTGYTFNEDGLHINRTGSELSSTLDETGLEVNRTGSSILTAKSDGVNALNLTSRQYLSVGNCRFEKYGYSRMACYWIGGN